MIQGPAYDLRAETYDFFFPDRSWEIAGWARLSRRYGRRVVEWMCGTGELACGLARRGLDVIGVDLMPEMLAVGERRASALPPERRPRWELDDIRDGALSRRENDMAFIAARSFGHMLAREEQMDALRTVRRHLRPGGALAMALGLADTESRPEQTGIFGPFRPTPPGLTLRKVGRSQYDAATGSDRKRRAGHGRHASHQKPPEGHESIRECIDALHATAHLIARHQEKQCPDRRVVSRERRTYQDRNNQRGNIPPGKPEKHQEKASTDDGRHKQAALVLEITQTGNA